MRRLVILLMLFGFSLPVVAQVSVDDNSADVGAPARYRLDPGATDPNSAEVGRPYYYGPYGYPYYNGYYRNGVQAVPDANDPNYFPPGAAVGAKQAPAPAPVKKKSTAPTLYDNSY